MDERYAKLAKVPEDARKKITGGNLKGMSDINPQWRYEKLTEVFGLCGEGWKFDILESKTVPVPQTGEVMVFVKVAFQYKTKDGWSEPITAYGGDFLINKDKYGIHGNDEGYKMAVTDALGTALKMIGVAADVYRGRYETKYSYNSSYTPKNDAQATQNTAPRQTNTNRQNYAQNRNSSVKTQNNTRAAVQNRPSAAANPRQTVRRTAPSTPPTVVPPQQAPQPKVTQAQANQIEIKIQHTGADLQKFLAYFHVNSARDLTIADFNKAMAMLEQKGRQARAKETASN